MFLKSVYFLQSTSSVMRTWAINIFNIPLPNTAYCVDQSESAIDFTSWAESFTQNNQNVESSNPYFQVPVYRIIMLFVKVPRRYIEVKRKAMIKN